MENHKSEIKFYSAYAGGRPVRLSEKTRSFCRDSLNGRYGDEAMKTPFLTLDPSFGATGENAIRVTAATADLILAPIGMLLADGILGEVTEPMAAAIGRSGAHKILVPSTRCGVTVAGVSAQPMAEYIAQAVRAAAEYIRACEG